MAIYPGWASTRKTFAHSHHLCGYSTTSLNNCLHFLWSIASFLHICPVRQLPSVLRHCWSGIRHSIQPVKTEWWGVVVVIWYGWCHYHPIVSCFIKIQNGFTFQWRITQVVLEKRPLNGCCNLTLKFSLAYRTSRSYTFQFVIHFFTQSFSSFLFIIFSSLSSIPSLSVNLGTTHETVCCFNATHPPNHSHLSPLKCQLVLLLHWPRFTAM